MTHRGAFQPRTFCDSVKLLVIVSGQSLQAGGRGDCTVKPLKSIVHREIYANIYRRTVSIILLVLDIHQT